MKTVKVNWSGGKDSTAAALMYLQGNYNVIIVNYTPFFNSTVPLISKEHYAFIRQMIERFRGMGATVITTTGVTYEAFCRHIITRGENKGKIQGFPYWGAGCCNFRNTKVAALNQINKSIFFDFEDIGIAFDEDKRKGQLNEKKQSILCRYKITENEAYNFCITENALSPHYKYNKRDGCALCPNAKKDARERWLDEYSIRKDLKLLQDFCMKNRPEHYPLRNKELFIKE